MWKVNMIFSSACTDVLKFQSTCYQGKATRNHIVLHSSSLDSPISAAKKRTACFCLLTGLNIVELAGLNIIALASLNIIALASLNMVVDRLVHACWNRLFMAWWTNRLEQRCWNHHDKSTAIFIHDVTDILVVVSSQVLHVLTYANNPCRFAKAVYNTLNHDWTILL